MTPPQHSALPHTILGYPRIGPDREIKTALEARWSGGAAPDLVEAIAAHRRRTITRLQELGLQAPYSVPAEASVIDQVLDTSVLLSQVPARFRDRGFTPEDPDTPAGLDLITALSRGTETLEPLELTKWFDTNYHYYVPELETEQSFQAQTAAVTRRFREQSQNADAPLRPVLLGPLTFLLLAKTADSEARGRLNRLSEALDAYADLLHALHQAGAGWVQLDEPALASDAWDIPREDVVLALARAYRRLGGLTDRPQLFVPISYGDAGDDALTVLGSTAVEAVGLDLTRGATPSDEALSALHGKTVVAGVVDGLNVWRVRGAQAHQRLRELAERHQGRVRVSTSTSLLHVPHDVTRERHLDPEIRSWLAFADQKVEEVRSLAESLDHDVAPSALRQADEALRRRRAAHPQVTVDSVQRRLDDILPGDRRRAQAAHRREAQRQSLRLPALTTTTIGSFPQTPQIRRTRAAHRAGRLDTDSYVEAIRAHITEVIRRQEEIGLDVLVHGEAERNDMVQYFAEHLEGFVTTTHGWVQSYGSRCLRPPILFGDVHRPEAITVDWIRWATAQTQKHVKGMLTGPVTILAWSFVRDDQPLAATADQIALALRDEVEDLQAAGVRIIQVDEPALRELLPLRTEQQPEYLRWSVAAFRLATSGASAATQLHTHLCYSEFETVLDAIDGLDADVTTLEASRSGFEVVEALRDHGFSRGIGPGVWDIHSPRVPSVEEITERVRHAAGALGSGGGHDIAGGTVWVNPDCGLKTRDWEETEASLRHLVAAARAVRGEQASTEGHRQADPQLVGR